MMDEQSRQEHIRSEAERRFAQLSPRERTAPPHGALAQWLDASPEHAQAYNAVRATWERLGALQDDPEMQALKAQVQARVEARQREQRSRNHSGPWRVVALAACLAVITVAGVMGWYWLQPLVPPTATFATAVGEQHSVTLEDGSAITLNTGTRLVVRIGNDTRQLALQQGEALFEVQPDKARAFVVQAGGGTVTALGTRFQVRHHGAGSTVTLLEGRVEVRNAQGRAVVLQPAEQARFSDADTDIAVQRVDPDAVTAWTRGWLIFRKEPLAQVLDEVNLYAKHKLRLGDPALAALPISGNFRIGDSAAMANALAALLPVEVEDTGAELVLRPRR